MMAELDESVDQITAPPSQTRIAENPVTSGVLAAALSDLSMLVTDRYDRSYLTALAPRITSGPQAGTLDGNRVVRRLYPYG